MSLAEILKQEGWQEGRQEGWQEANISIAKNMLLAGSDPVFVVKVTQLSLQTVKALQKQIDSV